MGLLGVGCDFGGSSVSESGEFDAAPDGAAGDAGIDGPVDQPGPCGSPGAARGLFATTLDVPFEDFGGAVLEIVQGSLELSGTTDSRARTLYGVDIRGSDLSFQLVEAAEGASSYSLEDRLDSQGVRFEVDDSISAFDVGGTLLGEVDYDSEVHRFLRFREDGGDLFLETSPNGNPDSWVMLGSSTPAPEFVSAAVLEMRLEGDGPDSLRIDDLNTLKAPALWCDVASINDKFNGNLDDVFWGHQNIENGCQITQTGGELVLDTTSAAGGGSNCLVASSSPFSLTDSAVEIDVGAIAVATVEFEAELVLEDRDGSKISVSYEDRDICARADDSVMANPCIAYNTTLRVWRISHVGPNLVFEVGAKNSLAVLATHVLPVSFNTDEVQVRFEAKRDTPAVGGPPALIVEEINP